MEVAESQERAQEQRGAARPGEQAVAQHRRVSAVHKKELAFNDAAVDLVGPDRPRIEAKADEPRVPVGVHRAGILVRGQRQRLALDDQLLVERRQEHAAFNGGLQGGHQQAVVAARARPGHRAAGETAQAVGLEPL